MPVVSPKPISCAPAAISRSAIAKTRSGGTGPSYGQPKATAITPSQRSPSSRARASTRSSPSSDSSIERLTFWRLCVSLALRKTLTSSKRSRCSSAFSSPCSFGMSTRDVDVVGHVDAPRAPRAASASCGMTSARTKLVTSRRLTPVRASTSMSATLSSVAMISGSFWKPSRGPTSRMRTANGSVVTASITRRSCVPTPIVRSPSPTSTSKRHLRSSTISRSVARAVQRAPSRAAPTCLMQTSKPTVTWPSARCSARASRQVRSIIPIIPGVERILVQGCPADVGQQVALDGEVLLVALVHAARAIDASYTRRPCRTAVTIIGATGALGFGLAVRLGRAGVPVVIGSRDAGRAGEAAGRARDARARRPRSTRPRTPRRRRAPSVVVLSVPFRNQSETSTNLKGVAARGPDPRRRDRPARRRGVAARRRARSASGRARPPSRRPRWSPTACASSARCTRSAPRCCATSTTTLDEDVLVCGDRRDDKDAGRRARRAHRRACAASTAAASRWRASPSSSRRC